MSNSPQKISYLIGAGATHACIQAMGSVHGVLMSHLRDELVEEVKKLVKRDPDFAPVLNIVNEIIDSSMDIEQLITFFDESPASTHRRLAEELRRIFELVLRTRLQKIEDELGEDRSSLYYVLLDLYNVEGVNGVRAVLMGQVTI